jgi:hypothetical protein
MLYNCGHASLPLLSYLDKITGEAHIAIHLFPLILRTQDAVVDP